MTNTAYETLPLTTVLVRYGAASEVARCGTSSSDCTQRGTTVVVRTHRGEELGTVLEALRPNQEPGTESTPPQIEVLRVATAQDLHKAVQLTEQAHSEIPEWEQRIQNWQLDLQLIDMEWTLDESRLILYVLNERGPECTKLALQAAAAGLGIIEVQPVSSEGPVALPPPKKGGCGSCGCH